MADLTITSASVVAATTASRINETAGDTVTAGEAVYKDSADSTWKPAKADAATTAGTAGKTGIALNGAASGQPLNVITSGNLTAGATLTVGDIYVVSAATAGGIAPSSDLVSTDYVTILGVATDATTLAVAPQASATAKA